MQYHAIIFAGSTKDAIIEGTVQLHPLPTTVPAFHMSSPILSTCIKHNRFNYKHLDNEGLHLRILRKPVPWRGIMLHWKHGKPYSALSNSQHCHRPSISWNKGLDWQDSITQLLWWGRVILLSSACSKRTLGTFNQKKGILYVYPSPTNRAKVTGIMQQGYTKSILVRSFDIGVSGALFCKQDVLIKSNYIIHFC